MLCMYADVSMRTLAHSICHTCSMEHHETGRDDKELASVCIEAEKRKLQLVCGVVCVDGCLDVELLLDVELGDDHWFYIYRGLAIFPF